MKNSSSLLIGVLLVSVVTAPLLWFMMQTVPKFYLEDHVISVDATQVTQVEIGDGTWKWSDVELPYDRERHCILKDADLIHGLCTALSNSHSNFFEHKRAEEFLSLTLRGSLPYHWRVELRKTISGDVYVGCGDYTYHGAAVEAWLHKVVQLHPGCFRLRE